MIKLNQNQKEFLLEYFFENEKYAGWKGIATKLIETGKCIVAGSECIWKGGVGNFIKTSEAEGTVGCCLYTFDLAYFMSSAWYKEGRAIYITQCADEKTTIEEKLKEAEAKYIDICNLSKF